jgi:hypothetical protein
MTTPSSPIGFSSIYSEANGASPGSATSFKTLASSSYFNGPNGSNTIAYNAWGQNKGIDGIFNVQGLGATPYKFSDYRSIPYYYDGTTTEITLNINSSVIGFPGNDFNITLYYRDSTLTYNYLNVGSFVPAGSSQTVPVSKTNTPLIYGCNWVLEVQANPPYPSFGTVTIQMTINGNNVLNPTSLVGGTNTFDYTGGGGGGGSNEYMQYNWPSSGLTGSYVDIQFF